MLEPDSFPTNSMQDGKMPTDIADIIADSAGSEQRFNPAFHPNSGPYGRFPPPPPHPPHPPPPPHNPGGRPRRPPAGPVGPPGPQGPANNNRPLQRSPYGNQFEFVDDNSLLGSGNFDVLGGGVFRDPGEYRPFGGNNNNYYNNPTPPPSRPYYPPGPPLQPPSQQLGNLSPPSVQQHQPPSGTIPSYPTSFFDDDFFSNFRDFADVNQDYRN